MPHTWIPGKLKKKRNTHYTIMTPVNNVLPDITPLLSGCNRPLKMSFEDQLNILVYFHLEEHHSGRHLLQVLKEDHFARQYIAPEGGIEKSSFFEDISSRGLQQMLEVFEKLYAKASKHLPKGHAELGDLVLIDGSLIDAVLSMYWADYRKGSKKAKVHIGFDLNGGIPKKIFLSDGKEAERPFVERILSPGETGVMDRGYQSHKLFDTWQSAGSKPRQKRLSSERMTFNSTPSSFTTPSFFWGPPASIRPKGNSVSSAIRWPISITGSPPIAMISPPSRSPSPISSAGI
jgi:hypothetical protein